MSGWENKSLSVAGDEEYHSSTYVQNDCTGDSCFLCEDTQLRIFDFCLGMKALKESPSFVMLFIEEFDSYAP